jgi:flagellar protein FlbD
MIRLTRLNNSEIIINAELIEMLEETPDVVLTLTTGRKMTVAESASEIIEKIIDYKSSIHSGKFLLKNDTVDK